VDLHRRGLGAQVQVAAQRGGIQRAGVDHLARGEHAQLDLRLALGEVGEARHQPARRKHRRRGDHQLGLVTFFADHLHRARQRVEALAQLRQAGARRVGELHAAAGAAEQFHTEVFLQRFHLVAHRRLRDVQLDRRILERQVARGGLEHA
jgi:hypothetical protein